MEGPISPLASPSTYSLEGPQGTVLGNSTLDLPGAQSTIDPGTIGNVASITSRLPDWNYEEEEFWWACQDDDITTVTDLLEAHPNMPLTTCNKDGLCPMYVCCIYKCNLVLSLLLTTYYEFLDVNQQTHIGCTPLHACCMSGNLEGVKLLVKRGADVDCPDNNGTLPVAMAEYHKHLDIVDYFYETGLVVEHEEEEVVEYWHCHICTKANELSTDRCECCGRLNTAVVAAREQEEEEKSKATQMSRIKAMSSVNDDNSVVSDMTNATELTKPRR